MRQLLFCSSGIFISQTNVSSRSAGWDKEILFCCGYFLIKLYKHIYIIFIYRVCVCSSCSYVVWCETLFFQCFVQTKPSRSLQSYMALLYYATFNRISAYYYRNVVPTRFSREIRVYFSFWRTNIIFRHKKTFQKRRIATMG